MNIKIYKEIYMLFCKIIYFRYNSLLFNIQNALKFKKNFYNKIEKIHEYII